MGTHFFDPGRRSLPHTETHLNATASRVGELHTAAAGHEALRVFEPQAILAPGPLHGLAPRATVGAVSHTHRHRVLRHETACRSDSSGRSPKSPGPAGQVRGSVAHYSFLTALEQDVLRVL